MIAYSVRKEGETSDKLILRFKKTFFQSRIASKLKAEKQRTRKPSKRKIREKAIIRAVYRDINNAVI